MLCGIEAEHVKVVSPLRWYADVTCSSVDGVTLQLNGNREPESN